MKKKNKAVWGGRFSNPTSKIFEEIGASIDVDKRLFAEDILGSIVHTQMLIKQKIIDRKKGNKIISGLKKIRNEIEKNKFKFNKKYEDIHLNIEKRLFSLIGKEAGYLHTARSRNDQVVTDFKLWIKNSNKLIINNALGNIISEITNLDRDTEDFELVVSSAGLDKPLRHINQYKKYIGRTVQVKLISAPKIEARLTEVREEGITLIHSEKKRLEGKKKKEIVFNL
jgi:hypothetical protein